MLNEKISELVWRESSRQARDMLKHHLKANEGRPADTIYGLRQIAINVLALAGYGNTQCWEEQEEQAPPGHQITYMDALHAVRVGFIIAALVPARILSLPIMPKTARTLGIAVQEFPVYTKEMLAKERAVSASSTQRRHNLMSALVRASDAEKGSNNKSSQSLSEAEIQGNLFQFTLAGFDTTANTMAYAVTNLVAYPEWQDWIIEEIDHVLQPQVDPDDYEAIFPKLGRCLALMVSLCLLVLDFVRPETQLDHCIYSMKSFVSIRPWPTSADKPIILSNWSRATRHTSFRPRRQFISTSTGSSATRGSGATMLLCSDQAGGCRRSRPLPIPTLSQYPAASFYRGLQDRASARA